WQESYFDHAALKIIARLSTRIFVPALTHNEEWLKIAVDYTIDFFTASYALRLCPPILRPFLHWVLPQTRKLRADIKIAKRLIEPELKASRVANQSTQLD
ncbi:hypothetical protein V2W45_1501641, partial [Cenococcum geophilum]